MIPRRRRTVYATGYAGGGAWRGRTSAAPAAGSDAAATEQDPVANGQGRLDTRLRRGDSADASAVAGDLAPTRTNQSVASDRNVPRSTEPNAAGLEELYGPPRPRAVSRADDHEPNIDPDGCRHPTRHSRPARQEEQEPLSAPGGNDDETSGRLDRQLSDLSHSLSASAPIPRWAGGSFQADVACPAAYPLSLQVMAATKR